MRIAIVGSGPTGVAVADTLLRLGHIVDMYDVGNAPTPQHTATAARLRELIESNAESDAAGLAQVIAEFSTTATNLWDALPFGPISSTAVKKNVLGSNFVWKDVEQSIPITGASPPRSLAKGGLSNVWGSACYALRAEDYSSWPLTESELAPHFRTAANLLGLQDHNSGLGEAYPSYASDKGPTLRQSRNPGSGLESITVRWRESVSALAQFGLKGGASCLATAWPYDRQDDISNYCRRCGLCHLGCPFGSIFTAAHLIESWREQKNYRYLGGHLVVTFEELSQRVRLHARHAGRMVQSGTYDRVVLAAGTLSSLRICADSLSTHGAKAPLLDNDMFVVPMLLDEAPEIGWKTSFTLSEAALALDAGTASEFPVHIQFYSLNNSMIPSPLRKLRRLPGVERLINRFVIGFIYLNSAESRQSVVVPQATESGIARLDAQSKSMPRTDIVRNVLKKMNEARPATGLRPLGQFLRSTPLGFSGHLSGTLPMLTDEVGETFHLRTESDGRLATTKYIYVADASTFPTLPAQNPTYPAMANAIRIASNIF